MGCISNKRVINVSHPVLVYVLLMNRFTFILGFAYDIHTFAHIQLAQTSIYLF